MNICVFGGGGVPGKFGYDFCVRTQQDGHHVVVISHKLHPNAHINHYTADFSNVENVVGCFENQCKQTPFDLILYNSTCQSYPDNNYCLTDRRSFDYKSWQTTIQIHAVIPHAVALCAQQYVQPTAAMVFFTTGLALHAYRDKHTSMVGYAGGKALQHHLMIGLAGTLPRRMIYTSVSPHFDPKTYSSVFSKIYNHLTHITPEWNGKYLEVWH